MLINTNYNIYAFSALLIASSSSFASSINRPCKHSPPAQAIEACQSKLEDESCSFQGRSHTIEGICFNRQENNVCVPNRLMNRFKLHEELVNPEHYRHNIQITEG